MRNYSRSHLADHDVFASLRRHLADERSITAELLADLAELDTRKLYLPAAYPSMLAYCIGELRFTEDSAAKRIQAARTAREHPTLFPMLADGRLNLSACSDEHATWHVPAEESQRVTPALTQWADEPIAPAPPPPQLISLQFRVRPEVQRKLADARALLSHAVPSGDAGEVPERALDALIEKLEKRRFAASSTTRNRRGSSSPRYIPADVKREVWKRDGSRCTFVSAKGHRCDSRRFLEFDHVDPVARGGTAASAGCVRLRCRAHNQYEAERVFGKAFMERKREAARHDVRGEPVRRAVGTSAHR